MKKSPNGNGQRSSLPQLRGVAARRWRYALAATAARPSDHVRTLKFKLELPAETRVSFNDVRALNKIVDGTGPGSLTHLLLSAHCSGLRLFMQEAGALKFRESADSSPSDFQRALTDAAGLTIPGFDPPGLRERFAKIPRARAGKDIRFVPEIIANEYARHFTGKAVADLDPARAAFFNGWAVQLHQEFQSEADGWAAIAAAPNRAAHTLAAYAHNQGWSLPSAARTEEATSASTIWASCVIAHDRRQPILDANSNAALYGVVAMRLAQLRAHGIDFDEKIRTPLQQSITTQTSAGLSWLFGRGLSYLQSAASVEEVAAGLGAPPDAAHQMQQLWDAARAIGPDVLFGAKGFSDYRRIIGGRLDSWLANYLNRLMELHVMLDTPVERFTLPESIVSGWAQWFRRTPLTPTGVQALLDSAFELREPARFALAALTGETAELVTEDTVATLKKYTAIVSEAAGALRILEKVLAPGDNDGATREANVPSASLVKAPTWLKELPKLNDFSGAIPNFEEELQWAATAYADLEASYAASMAHLHESVRARGASLSELAFHGIVERSKSTTRAPIADAVARELALRQILHRFARVAIACGPRARIAVRDLYMRWGVFRETADANRYFINQNGSLYRSPYSRSRHEAYALGELKVAAEEVIGALHSFANSLAPEPDQGLDTPAVLRLRQSADALLLAGLRDESPRQWFQWHADERYVRVPVATRMAMEADQWSPDLVARYFNLMGAAKISMRSLLERDRFFVRARFQRVGDTELCYRPKPTSWAVPDRLSRTPKPIGEAIRTLARDGKIEAADSLARALAYRWEDKKALSAYLQQAPHDWYYVPGFAQTAKTPGWLVVDGKKGSASKTSQATVAGRLVGPPSYKTELDRLLENPRQVSFGDITLIVDQEYRQRVTTDSNGHIKPVLETGTMTLSVAIPLSMEPAEPKDFPYADRVVAIDQGEVGIGFAVYDVKSGSLVASGHRRIPSIRRLIGKAKSYRKTKQKAQKFQQRFDSTLFNMRENVVGDVCSVICQLMHAYRAFPVLESQVGNLESGSRQLDLVYKAVTARFCYSDVPAQNAERKAYWLGSDRWKHPYLQGEAWEDGKKSGKRKPLSLYPGARAPTAGTSQQCSYCRRNPIRELWSLKESGTKSLEVGRNGTVSLPSGMIALNQRSDDTAVFKRARRRNERAPLDRPLEAGLYAMEYILPTARLNLRQPPTSRQSRDTTQSVYQCLYVDCGKRDHADENAARNIGKRFLTEKVLPL